MSEQGASFQPLRVLGRYEIIRRLTSGGMGDIFLARQVGVAGFERLVILKSLKPEVLHRGRVLDQFLAEARIVAQLNHPNVVAVLEVDEFRGVHFIAMEYIAGVDLGMLHCAVVQMKQRVPFRICACIALGAARGLAHAHGALDQLGTPAPIVHRDVSPQNVMVRRDGLVKVVDFGIAIVSSTARNSNVLQGKLRYMSPEQASGQPIGPASDQFSLGVVLWELCTLKRLIPRGSAQEMLKRVVTVRPPRLSSLVPDIPQELEGIIMRALSMSPAGRFSDMGAMEAELLAFLQGTGGPAEQSLGLFVDAMLGGQIEARTKELRPVPVQIPGLLMSADLECSGCGMKNDLRSRFCGRCGASLVQAEAREVEVEVPGTSSLNSEPARKALLSKAKSAARLQMSEERPAVVIVGRFVRSGGLPGALQSKAWFERIKEACARRAVEATRLNDSAFAAVLQESRVLDGASVALEICKMVESLVRRASFPMQTDCYFGVACGAVSPRVRSKENAWDGAAIEEATQIASTGQRAGCAGLMVSAGIVELLNKKERFEPLPQTSIYRWIPRLSSSEKAIVGRTEALMTFQRALHDALQENRGTSLLVAGEAGLGKTRYLKEAERISKRHGAVPVYCVVEEDAPALSIWMALWEAAKVVWEEQPALVQASGIDPVLAAVAVALPDEVSTNPVHWERGLLEFWAQLSLATPVSILVDNVHLLDESSQSILRSLWARAAKVPMLVCGASRTTEPGWAQTLQLGPLSDEALITVAQSFWGDSTLPSAVAQHVVAGALGNPGAALLVVEHMRAQQGSELQAEVSLGKARALNELVLWQIGRMEPRTRAMLQVGAVSSERFDPAVVANMMPGMSAAQVRERVLRTGFVEPVRDQQGLRFLQTSFREGLLSLLSERERKVLHERVGVALIALARDPTESAAQIAHHLLNGEARLDAAHYALCAAAQPLIRRRALYFVTRGLWVMRTHMESTPTSAQPGCLRPLEPALLRYGSAALEACASVDLTRAEALLVNIDALMKALDPVVIIHLLEVRARIRLRLGNVRVASEDAKDAEALCSATGILPGARLIATQALIHEANGMFASAVRCVQESLENPDVPDNDFLWEQSNVLGRIFSKQGELAQAEVLFSQAFDIASASGRLGGQAASLTNRGVVAAQAGDRARALELLSEAQRIAELAEEPVAVARALFNQGCLWSEDGEVERAKQALNRSMEISLAVGWVEGQANARGALQAL